MVLEQLDINMQKIYLGIDFTFCTKIDLKLVIDLNVNAKL